MKNIRKVPPRHFPYQHPTFGTDKKPKTPRNWEDTVYYLWWAYLKRNEDYLKTCEAKGKGKLSALYKDFGDVRGDDFKRWWNEDERGANLFSNPITEDRISLLSNGDKAIVRKTCDECSFKSSAKVFSGSFQKDLGSTSHGRKR